MNPAVLVSYRGSADAHTISHTLSLSEASPPVALEGRKTIERKIPFAIFMRNIRRSKLDCIEEEKVFRRGDWLSHFSPHPAW